jgi:ubiquinone biosynthesis protein
MGMIPREEEGGEAEVAERAITYFQKRFLEQMTVESWSLKDIQVDMKTKLEAIADLKKLDVSFRQLTNVIQVPKEWVIFERASVLLLGLCTQIDPNMNPIRTVGPYLQQFVLGKDTDWKGQITTAIREMAMSAVAIPDRMNRFLERANRGDTQIQLQGLQDSALLLYSAAQQIIFVLLATAIGALGYVLDARGDTPLAVAAWVVAALCLVAVMVSMLRARTLRRMLRGRRSSS